LRVRLRGSCDSDFEDCATRTPAGFSAAHLVGRHDNHPLRRQFGAQTNHPRTPVRGSSNTPSTMAEQYSILWPPELSNIPVRLRFSTAPPPPHLAVYW
jgi:hypothetical protein